MILAESPCSIRKAVTRLERSYGLLDITRKSFQLLCVSIGEQNPPKTTSIPKLFLLASLCGLLHRANKRSSALLKRSRRHEDTNSLRLFTADSRPGGTSAHSERGLSTPALRMPTCFSSCASAA